MISTLKNILSKPVSIAPLITFRVLFGFMMLCSILRFITKGWVYEQYIRPEYHFTYYGFEWVQVLPPLLMYAIFGIMALAALGIMMGWAYHWSAALFFLTFTYVELIDKTYYLNHYYFVSVMALVLVFLPLGRVSFFKPKEGPIFSHIPQLYLLLPKVIIGLVYFYAGVAKLNPEWLFEALPLRIWLPANSHLPLVGPIMGELWLAYAFSWFGAIYDLSIPFLLCYRKTRKYAFFMVVVFHMSTWLLFPIGMFPFIMIASSTLFFSTKWHRSLWSLFPIKSLPTDRTIYYSKHFKSKALLLGVFLLIQVLLPWRFLAYPGKLFWTEQGYRFSWRVMLMEKAGYAIFHIRDPLTDRSWEIYAKDYLTPAQEKQMSTQPDMILQFAHFLKDKLREEGLSSTEIRAEVYVSLNGQASKLLIDPSLDLSTFRDDFGHKTWILPYSR